MANCINSNHPEFIGLQKELNIDSTLLEASITKWQEDNKIFDKYPSKEEISKFLAKKNNKIKQHIGSSRVLKTIAENEEENIISNGVYFLGTVAIQKQLTPDNALNIYLKGVYNRMNKINAVESAEELKRKLTILKLKIANNYKTLFKEDIKLDSDSIVIENSNEVIDENLDNDNIDNNESGSVEQSWNDNIASISSISLANIQLKRNIAFLPNRYNEGSNKGDIIYDKFGNPELVELEPAYNFLQNVLVNSNTKAELLERLRKTSEYRTEFKPLYEALVNPNNKQLSAQFFKLMNFTKNEKSMTRVKFIDNKGADIEVFDADRVNASKQILKLWQKNFNVLNITDNLFHIKEIIDPITKITTLINEVNKDKFKPLYEDLDDFRKNRTLKSSKEEAYNKWSDVLSKIGIVINPEAFKSYIDNDQKVFDSLQSSVLQSFRYAYQEGTSPLDHSSINIFSKVQASYQFVDSNSTFSNVENNKEQTFIIPSAVNKLLNSYKSKEGINILTDLSRDPSFHKSFLINLLKTFPEDVNIKVEGGIKENTPNGEGVSYSNMSPLELEFTKLSKFINTTREASSGKHKIGQIFTLVPSDGSTMPTLQVPIIRGKYIDLENPAFVQKIGANKKATYADNYSEMLFDLFSQEQIKIRESLKFKNRILELKELKDKTPEDIKELKDLEDNAIELYDFKYIKGNKDYSKGAATKFNDFDIFNDEVKYNDTINPLLGISFQEAQKLLTIFTYEKSLDNKPFEIEDINGNKIESNTRIIIDPESKNKLKLILYSWLINKKNKQYQNWNNLGLLSDKFKLSKFVGNNLEYSNYEELALEYVFNSFLYSSETQKIFTGDVSFSGSKENYQKRNKAMVSPSITPDLDSMDRKTYKLGIIRDIIKPSEFLSSIKEGLKNIFKEDEESIDKIINSYENINVADGMGYLHYKEALNIYKGLGQYGKKYAVALKDLESGNPSQKSLSILLPMMKDNHVSITYDPIRKVVVTEYIKNAKFLLFPSLVKDTPLQELYDYMDSVGVHHILYESAIKKGAKGVEQLENKDNTYSFDKLHNIIPKELSYEFWGLQSDTVEHHLDAENKQGVQVSKLITQGLKDNFKFSDNTTGEDLKKEYRKLQAINILEDYKDLIESIKTDEDVRNLILAQLTNIPDNVIQLFDLDEDGNFISPLFLNMEFCKKIESVLNGLYKNRIVNQKMNGGSFKQASCFGLINKHKFRSLEGLPDSYKGGINWLKGNEGKLDFYIYKEGKVKSAQCLLPAWSKEFMNGNNTIDINELPLELRQIIGYRIPTQSKSSMFSLEVVGFLPKEVGSTIVLPEDVTKLMGSDFDIDTLYTMIPNFEKLDNPNIETSNIESLTKKGVDDIFKESPELAIIGNTQQYSQYLNSIFPDSKVKDIVYHGTPDGRFDNFDLSKVGKTTFQRTKGIFFTDSKKTADFYAEGSIDFNQFDSKEDYEAVKIAKVFMAILNAKNLKLVNNPQGNNKNGDAILRTEEKLSDIGFNGELDYAHQYIVFEPKQIHILGNEKDIENFKQFVNQSKKSNNKQNFNKITDLNTREGRDNKIQDIFRKILLEPKLFNETIAPLDSDLLKNVRDRALLLLDTEDIKDSVNLPYIQTEMSMVNMMGKALIGVFANYNANRSIAEDTNLRILDKKHSIKFNAIEATELYNITNFNKNNIASQISEMLSAAVDNAKELIHYTINSNTYTASVYAIILESGHDLTTASYFMLQSSIVKAYNKQKSNSGINNTFENTIDVIKKEYFENIKLQSKLKVELEENKSFNFSDNEMQESLVISRFIENNKKLKNNPVKFEDFIKDLKIKKLGLDFKSWNPDTILEDYSTMQIKVLHSFESYKKLSSQRNLILKNQKIDGYNGNSLAHLEILKNNIDNNTKDLLTYDDSRLVNQKALYETLLGYDSNSAVNFISKYIPFNTEAFLKAKNSIINKLGIKDNLKNAFTGEKILNKINYELLTAINGSKKSPFFKDKSSKDYIKQLVLDKGLYNAYNELIKEYPFLKGNYFLKKIDFNTNKELVFDMGIPDKRSVERLQNAFEELLEGFGVIESDKQKVRVFALNLVRYSYLTKGFQSGFDSFIKYLPTEFLQSSRLGYNNFIKEVQDNLNNPEFISENLVNEVIGNLFNTKGIVKFVNTKQYKVIINNTSVNITTKNTLPEFINIFDKKVLNLKLLNQHININGDIVYNYIIITPLGRKSNGRKLVGLKEYSGEGLNFKEKTKIITNNTTLTGKPIINNITFNNKGEDLEDICK